MPDFLVFYTVGDWSTDKGIIEQELVYVRFVDNKRQIQTKLGGILEYSGVMR